MPGIYYVLYLSFAFKKRDFLLPAPPLGNTGFDLTLGSKMSVISFFLTLSLPATCLLRLDTLGDDLRASGTGILVTGSLKIQMHVKKFLDPSIISFCFGFSVLS